SSPCAHRALPPFPTRRSSDLAPTGKAAARLGQAITELARETGDAAVASTVEQVNPQTIHRLLGWTWGRSRFLRDRTNRLPHEIEIGRASCRERVGVAVRAGCG